MVIVHDHDGDDDDAGDRADDDDARDDAAQQGQWALMIRIRAVRSPTGRCAQQGAKAARGCDAYRRSKRCRGTGRHAPHPSILLQPPFHQIIHPSIHWNRCYVSDGVADHELGMFLSRLHCSRPGLSYIALHQSITKSRLLQGAATPRLPFHCLFPQRRQPFFLCRIGNLLWVASPGDIQSERTQVHHFCAAVRFCPNLSASLWWRLRMRCTGHLG